MKNLFLVVLILFISCKKYKIINESFHNDLTLSFGSCNNQNIPNILFKEILKNKPKAFIWGGDIIYSDTQTPAVLRENYIKFKKDSLYAKFKDKIEILATWDDHDYGINDGGTENKIKIEAQSYFLDFLDVSKENKRRKQKGIYYSKTIKQDTNSIKIIVLDTRYFRTNLTKNTSGKKRYIPNNYGEGTMLGNEQWLWLENELLNSKANFNIIVSSIQFLSSKHGFESWGNMPHEVDTFKKVIIKTKAKNVIILSGDRHISELSKTNIGNYKYPLIDFTSSGMTHIYSSFHGEENPFRISNVIYEINFGLLKFDFKNKKVLFEIKGKNNIVLEKFTQQY